MSDLKNIEKAKKNAEDAAERLFGKRTSEQEKALREVKIIGSPQNLIERDSESFDDEDDSISKK